ncbi:MAG: hypothetical protein M0R51_10055 [Clostridia bacterium]|jgi:hypothetical protein|nr:hypothetical protein [Clostridia bacterium]
MYASTKNYAKNMICKLMLCKLMLQCGISIEDIKVTVDELEYEIKNKQRLL